MTILSVGLRKTGREDYVFGKVRNVFRESFYCIFAASNSKEEYYHVMEYNSKAIDAKWQQYRVDGHTYRVTEDAGKPKYYAQTIKYLLLFCLVLIPIVGTGQTANSLSEMLWSRVSDCYSMFEDWDDDGIPDFDKTDDSRNGYLRISGSWPTCGCSCASTVGAYRNSAGEYIVLQVDNVSCDWKNMVSSNKALNEILPEGFGISSFISRPIPADKMNKIKHPVFFARFDIPRIGTDTKVKLETIPFGLIPERTGLLCYEYVENYGNNSKSLWGIKDIAREIQDNRTLDFILNGEFDKITQPDKSVIQKTIRDDERDAGRFRSKEELRQYLIELEQVYQCYLLLETTEITLGWNRQDSRFYIKEKKGKPENVTFKEFLLKNAFWGSMC